MIGRAVGQVDARRSLIAVAIVAGIVAAPVAVDAVVEGVFAPVEASARGSDGIDADVLTACSDPMKALDQIDELVADCGDELPEAFSDEIGLPKGARDVRVSECGSVVGCLLEKEEEEALEIVARALSVQGWTEVPLGQVTGATFVKNGGSCTWVLVTCTQAGDETSVVYRGEFS